MAEAMGIAIPAAATVCLTCHAPHIDRRRMGHPCGRTLFVGRLAGLVAFITIADRRPNTAGDDGDFWFQCPNPKCQKWNRFRLVIEAGRLV